MENEFKLKISKIKTKFGIYKAFDIQLKEESSNQLHSLLKCFLESVVILVKIKSIS